MKKRILLLITAILCAIMMLSGCGLGSFIDKGTQKPPVNPVLPDNPDNPDTPDNPAENNHYTVTVYYGTKPYNPGEADVTVVWKNDLSVKRVKLGEDGVADAGELDGSFYIYLEGLPENYSYNPSAYTATSDERHVALLLTDIRPPISGNGRGQYSCYKVRYDGTYRATIPNKDVVLYYEYQPEAAGVYSVVTWVNAFENKINPYMLIYGGTFAFKWYEGRLDDGGFSTEGGYTKNVRQEYRIDRTEVGGSFTFAIGAESKTDEYPIYVDFAITYEGEYTNEYADVRAIRAKEAIVKADEKKANEEFVYANELSPTGKKAADDELLKEFDASNVKYNGNTGFYHYYSEILYADDPCGYGKNFGPILCCLIDKQAPCYSTTSLYNANSVGLGSNYLRLSNVWLEEEQKFVVLDYTAFIREDYKKVCNSEGVCYVTKELKDFLQMYAERHSLYTDNVSPVIGSPEEAGYSAKQDALWLFACGAYLPK